LTKYHIPKSLNINFTPKFVKYSRMVVTVSTCSQADLKRDKFFSIIDAALRNLKEQKENTGNNKERY